MTSVDSSEDRVNGMSKSNPKSQTVENKSSGGPTVLFLWIWNWLAALPKTFTNWYADFKSGELLARFTLLDAMCQFIVAVATSCHPQGISEEPMDDDIKENGSYSPKKSKSDAKVFQGTARTLRSRTVESK